MVFSCFGAKGATKESLEADQGAIAYLSVRSFLEVKKKKDAAKVIPRMEKYVAENHAEDNMYYSFSEGKIGKKTVLVLREGWTDANAYVNYMTGVMSLLQEMGKFCQNMGAEVFGPKAQCEKLKEKMGTGTDKCEILYFESDGLAQMLNGPAAGIGREKASRAVSIEPVFTVLKWDEALEGLPKLVDATKTEEGAITYGFSRTVTKLFCRELYVDGGAALAHLANVGATLGALLEGGIIKLDQMNLVGPEEELKKIKKDFEQMKPNLFNIV